MMRQIPQVGVPGPTLLTSPRRCVLTQVNGSMEGLGSCGEDHLLAGPFRLTGVLVPCWGPQIPLPPTPAQSSLPEELRSLQLCFSFPREITISGPEASLTTEDIQGQLAGEHSCLLPTCHGKRSGPAVTGVLCIIPAHSFPMVASVTWIIQ